MKKYAFWEGIYDLTYVKKDGSVLWTQSIRNSLVQEGADNIGDVYLRVTAEPAGFYLRLCYDTLATTDILTTVVGEPSGYGYAPASIERSTVGWPTKELDDGDWMYTSKEVSFTASSGDIGPFNTVYLATSEDNAGKLVGFVNLATERTILSGDTMLARLRIKFK